MNNNSHPVDGIERVLGVYYTLVTGLELLHNYSDLLLFKQGKLFHNHTEKKYYNVMMQNLKSAKFNYEMYQKENAKLECTIRTNDNEILENPNNFIKIDEGIKSGKIYIMFLLLLQNAFANADSIDKVIEELKDIISKYIKTWYIPEEYINYFAN